MNRLTPEYIRMRYRRHGTGQKIYLYFCAVTMLLNFIAGMMASPEKLHLLSGISAALIIAATMIYAFAYHLTPESMLTMPVYYRTKSDPVSQRAAQLYREAAEKSGSRRNKGYYLYKLGYIYLYLDDPQAALEAAGSIDRTLAVNELRYYDLMTDIYESMDDMQSALALYKEAEPVVAKHLEDREFEIFCLCVEIARTYMVVCGDHAQALSTDLVTAELLHIALSADIGVPGKVTEVSFESARRQFSIAYLYYMCGDAQKAAQILPVCSRTLTISPLYTRKIYQLQSMVYSHG